MYIVIYVSCFRCILFKMYHFIDVSCYGCIMFYIYTYHVIDVFCYGWCITLFVIMEHRFEQWILFPTGLDVTEIPIYFLNEQHITGDISFALRQYLYMTRDIRFLNESGIKLVQEIAEFWASRVFLNSSTNMYEIHGRLTNSSAHTCELNEVK